MRAPKQTVVTAAPRGSETSTAKYLRLRWRGPIQTAHCLFEAYTASQRASRLPSGQRTINSLASILRRASERQSKDWAVSCGAPPI